MSQVMCGSRIRKATVGVCIVLSLQGLATSPEAMAASEGNSQEAQRKRYREAESIDQAIDILKEYLEEQDLSVYAPLFTKESVAAGVENSLHVMKRRSRSVLFEAQNSVKARESVQRSIDYKTKYVEPACQEVMAGKWPKNVYFFCMPPQPKFSTLTVNLVVDHRGQDLGGYEIGPGITPTGFGVNVVTIKYGLEPLLKGQPTMKGTIIPTAASSE